MGALWRGDANTWSLTPGVWAATPSNAAQENPPTGNHAHSSQTPSLRLSLRPANHWPEQEPKRDMPNRMTLVRRHSPLERRNLRHHRVVPLAQHTLPQTCHVVRNLARVSGQFCRADCLQGDHLQNLYALVTNFMKATWLQHRRCRRGSPKRGASGAADSL